MSIISDLCKEYKVDIAIGGEFFAEQKRDIIPVSPILDIGLSGGIPSGSWVTITGFPKFGKSSLALHIAAKAQIFGYTVVYLNIEGRLKLMNLTGTQQLDLSNDKFVIIQSTEDKILSAQDYLTIGEKILLGNRKIFMIIDSYSVLCHEKELTDGIGTSTRGGGALLLSQFTRQMSNVVPVKDHIIVGITHLMANTSGYGVSMIEKGGNSILYQADVKIKAKKREYIESGTSKVGQKVDWVVECSALGPPGYEGTGYIRYGVGIDEISELISVSKDLGFITSKGAWTYFNFLENNLELTPNKKWDDEAVSLSRCHGIEDAYEKLKCNPSWVDILYKNVQSLLVKK